MNFKSQEQINIGLISHQILFEILNVEITFNIEHNEFMKEFKTRINFFVASFISIVGLTLVSEIIMENDIEDKIDDVVLLVLGLIAMWWYKKSGNKGASVIPAIWISGIAVIVKIAAVIIEHGDKEALGDDFALLTACLLSFIFVVWQVLSHKKNAT